MFGESFGHIALQTECVLFFLRNSCADSQPSFGLDGILQTRICGALAPALRIALGMPDWQKCRDKRARLAEARKFLNALSKDEREHRVYRHLNIIRSGRDMETYLRNGG